jgi:hypothetical protein
MILLFQTEKLVKEIFPAKVLHLNEFLVSNFMTTKLPQKLAVFARLLRRTR